MGDPEALKVEESGQVTISIRHHKRLLGPGTEIARFQFWEILVLGWGMGNFRKAFLYLEYFFHECGIPITQRKCFLDETITPSPHLRT